MHNTKRNWAETEQSGSLGSAKQRDRDNVSFGVGSNQVQAAGLGALLTLERNRLSSPAKAIPQHSLQDWHNHAKCWSRIPAPQRKLQHPKETAWKGWALFSYIQFFYRTLYRTHPSSLTLWVSWPTPPAPNRLYPQIFFILALWSAPKHSEFINLLL